MVTWPPGWSISSALKVEPVGQLSAPGEPGGPGGPCWPVGIVIVVVEVGAWLPIPSAVEARKPAPPANASASTSGANCLILLIVPRYLDALVERPLELGDPLVTVRLGASARPPHIPGGTDRAADPGEEHAKRRELVGRHTATAPRP